MKRKLEDLREQKSANQEYAKDLLDITDVLNDYDLKLVKLDERRQSVIVSDPTGKLKQRYDSYKKALDERKNSHALSTEAFVPPGPFLPPTFPSFTEYISMPRHWSLQVGGKFFPAQNPVEDPFADGYNFAVDKQWVNQVFMDHHTCGNLYAFQKAQRTFQRMISEIERCHGVIAENNRILDEGASEMEVHEDLEGNIFVRKYLKIKISKWWRVK